MPEIAEVETLRRQIAGVLPFTVTGVRTSGGRSVRAHDPQLLQQLVGTTMTGVGRRGKWLAVHGSETGFSIHLRMSGRLHWHHRSDEVEPHTHVVFESGGHELRFVDARTFGEVSLWAPGEPLGSAAPDALDDPLHEAAFADAFARTSTPVKAVLLDQRRVVQGLGNIYADEVRWQAGIDPRTSCKELTMAQIGALVAAIRPVAEAGAAHRGTALADEGWKDLHGALGGHGPHLVVHARTSCAHCDTPVQKTKFAGRSTYWCTSCQQ